MAMLLCRGWEGDEPLEERDESARVTVGGFSMPRRRLPPRWVITPATASKRASTFNEQESRVTACLSASDVSSVPIVTKATPSS